MSDVAMSKSEIQLVIPEWCRGTDSIPFDEYMPFKEYMQACDQREKYVNEYAWAIPSEEALEALVKLSPLVEIGAGRGYWAGLLAERGADIVCYDSDPPDGWYNRWCHKDHAEIRDGKQFYPVKKGGPYSAVDHCDRTLFLCWPPLAFSMALDSLKAWTGNHVAYIGESEGGCCADDEFFEILKNEFEEVQDIRIPQWPGLHDSLVVYKRKCVLPPWKVL